MTRLHCALLTLAMALVTPAISAQAEEQTQPLSPFQMKKAERTQLESMLKAEVQRTVNGQKRIEGQGKHPTVLAVRFEARDEFGNGNEVPFLIIDLSKSYLPRNTDYMRGVRHIGGELEYLLSELHESAYGLLQDTIHINGIQFLFNGRDIYYYYPEDSPPEYIDSSRKNAAATTTGPIVVAAGHGIYRHYGSACGQPWCPQRDEYNGITEDFITPGYADELAYWLNERSQAVTSFVRSRDTALHTPSGHQWWEMAARYYLEELYPDNPEIWNSLQGEVYNQRDYDEDIRSRPFFANHIGADTIFHLHTNGPSSTATGVRVFYHAGRAADGNLGNSILCYMKELIHAQESYEDYNVPSSAIASTGYGENRLAEMPSLVIETGFHTNPSDAAALKDPAFRTAAMKGVEKGYRLHTAGEPCAEFKITDIPEIGNRPTPPGQYAPLIVFYEGYPQFPATSEIEILDCPSSVICEGGIKPAWGESSPLAIPFRCGGAPSNNETIKFRARLIDVDGVKTEWKESDFTCIPPS